MDKTILNETLANPTENNLVASVNSYLIGANRKDEAIIVNRLIDEKDPIIDGDKYSEIEEEADKIEEKAMEKNASKSQVQFSKNEFDEESEIEKMGDDEPDTNFKEGEVHELDSAY